MFHKRKWTRLAAGVLALSLVTAACGNDDESSSDTTQKTDESGGGNDNSLIGMKGTTPLVDLGDEFKGRLMEIDPSLVDFNYAAESYDAAIILGLAATEAKTDGSAMAEKINGITRDGEKCTDFAACKKLIEAGTDIDYDGQSGPLEFSGNGEPTEASYGVLQFGTTDCEDTTECLDDSKTQFIVATAPEEADVDQVAVEDTQIGRAHV